MEDSQHLLFGGSESVRLSNKIYRPSDFADLHVVSVAQDLSPEILRKRPISLNYQGLCPLHHETRPSFVVRPLENRFCCYGCGEHGGAFQLLIRLTNSPLNYLSQEFNFDFARDRIRLAEILRTENIMGRFDFLKYAHNFGID